MMLVALGAELRAVQVRAVRTGAAGRPRLASRSRSHGPEGAGYDYTVKQVQQVEKIVAQHIGRTGPIQRANPRVPGGFGASEEMHTGRISVFLQDWTQARRSDTAERRASSCRANWRSCPACASSHAGQRRPGAHARPAGADRARRARLRASWRSGATACWRASNRTRASSAPTRDYKETRPQMRVEIDRQRAADLGVSVERHRPRAGNDDGLRAASRPSCTDGEEYDVIVQSDRELRATPADLAAIQVRARDGALVPLSNLVTLQDVGRTRQPQPLQPPARDHHQRGPRARLSHGRCDRMAATGRAGGTAGAGADRLEGRVARIPAGRRRGDADLRAGVAGRVPGAGGAVRELHPSVRDHADGAAGRARRADRPVR